ncbi:DUF4333 domain-containing protein [Spiractinospora alimapuensis]|uniref:DUF4333 domain-containing protein n=1 Tax=Spiractinospora alimapuensis TaxID=2820884 RepID=UPI001F428DA8|nr:DUF4333 domain-containing protein [Spiractinospora alimapuensis]QVQ53927.1 DUF4333 domain-containing protein [Spiractinospora alimapuensis]
MTSTRSRQARIPRIPLGAAVFAAFLAASGCQSELNEAELTSEVVDSGELASQISARLAEQFDREPDSLHCPDDLPALEGASVTCALTDTDHVFDITVTTTSVEGETVNFDFAVAEEPRDAN